ncbi:MAG TPA: type II secretion system protein [Gemmatimonadaceae bacterium]|nr:type II secretion system protein [Gemmatimonadaceae bacterium]
MSLVTLHHGEARRVGWMLSELVVVLAIAGLLGTLVGATLVRQQRFYRGATELVRSREGVRDAIAVLAPDIRGLAVADTVRMLADSAMEFFAGIGSSVVCASDGGWMVGLPAAHSHSGNTLTAFNVEPDTGDFVFFYRDSSQNGSQWERHRLVSFGSSAFVRGCRPSSGPQPTDSSAGLPGYVLSLASPLSSHVRNGAPVRFARRNRYSLYRSSDGEWFLGYRRCNALGPSTCGSIQPLSGPYRPYSASESETGLLFRYFDRSGHRMAPDASPLVLGRVDITARSESRQRIREGSRTLVFGDSATISIAVRNKQ